MKIIFVITILMLSSQFNLKAQITDTKEKYHEFDFWLGEWDVYNKGEETIQAHSLIESVIDSFAIQENYRVIGGSFKGKSFNKFNPQTSQWEQFWVDNGGLSLLIKGGLDDKGRMVMGNENIDSTGTITKNEISWELLNNGNVNQIWRTKIDNAEWTIVFDGVYKRRK